MLFFRQNMMLGNNRSMHVLRKALPCDSFFEGLVSHKEFAGSNSCIHFFYLP